MTTDVFFAFKKIKSFKHLHAAVCHNKRMDQFERGSRNHIDPKRSHLNLALAGESDPQGVRSLAHHAIQSAGIKLRKNGVLALEFVFSLHRQSGLGELAYFQDCVTWMGRVFGVANILAADVHLDEAAPHMHLLVLPLINGRMKGSEAVGLKEWRILRSEFMKEVAGPYGLREPAKRLVGHAKERAEQDILHNLQAREDEAMKSVLWPLIRKSIASDPRPYLAALGVPELVKPVKAKGKSFTQIMTGKGKPTAEDRKSNHY